MQSGNETSYLGAVMVCTYQEELYIFVWLLGDPTESFVHCGWRETDTQQHWDLLLPGL